MMKTVLALLLLGGIAAADVHTNKASAVSVDVPKTYKLTEQDQLMRGESGDKAVALLFWVLDNGDPDDATKKLGNELYSMVGSLQWDKPKTDKQNGLAVTRITGTGRSVGNTLDLSVLIVGPTATKKYALVVGIVDHAKADAHKAEIAAILKSVKPAK